jgi:hypothetical protein
MLQEAEQNSALELCKIDDERIKAEKALESKLKQLLEDIEEARKSKDPDVELLIRGESRSTGGEVSHTLNEQNRYARVLSQIHWVALQGQQDSGEAALQQVDAKWTDIERLETWLSICDNEHGHDCAVFCAVSSHTLEQFRLRLAWLVDVYFGCLVPYEPDCRYVALSYVWGNIKSTKTVQSNLLTFLGECSFFLEKTRTHNCFELSEMSCD